MSALNDNLLSSDIPNMTDADKVKVMKQQEKGAFYSSASQIATFMAGVLTAAAMGIIGPALTATVATTIPTIGFVFLGAAALATLTAVGCNMKAQKITSSAYFDQSETNAKHNAKYIVQEFAKSACVEHEQNCRNDGKGWSQVVAATRTVSNGSEVDAEAVAVAQR